MIRIINNKYYGVTSLDHLYPIPIFDGEIFIYQVDFGDFKHLLCKYQPYNRSLVFREYESYPNRFSETKQLCITLKMFLDFALSSNIEHATKMILYDFYETLNLEFEKYENLIKELKNFIIKNIKLNI